MVTHFFYDITHFDSNFFHTIHHLIFKPGFLSAEYMNGRRATYLHPIRMYVFTSAIFFLLFFSFFTPKVDSTLSQPLDKYERDTYIKTLQFKLSKDSNDILTRENLRKAKDSTIIVTRGDRYFAEGATPITFNDRTFSTKAEYDSLQKALPAAERDGWIMRKLAGKAIAFNAKYGMNPEEGLASFLNASLHKLPYMLFISLPLFAFILQLIYFRSRKKFYYADHGVFTIHLYIFSFLLLLLVFSITKLEEYTGWGFLNWLSGGLFILLLFYLYKGMRNFYKQRRGKTFLKFLLTALLSLIMMALLFIFLLVFSVFTI